MNEIISTSGSDIVDELLVSIHRIKAAKTDRLISTATVQMYTGDMKQYIVFCSIEQLPILDKNLIGLNQFKQSLQGKASHTTVNRKLVSIRRVLTQYARQNLNAIDSEIIISALKSVHGVRLNRNHQIITEDKILSKKEIETLINGLSNKRRISLMIQFLYQSGCRISEMTGIRLNDISETRTNFQIQIIGKGYKMRIIRIKKDLISQIKNTFSGHEFLFETQYGNRYYRGFIGREIRMAGKRIINRDIHPHLFRHSFVSHKISETGKIKAVSEYVGNASAGFTMDVYCHESLNDDDLFAEL